MKLTTYWFKKWKPCRKGVEWFLENFDYGANTKKVIKKIIKDNELDYANWALVRCMTYEQYVKYACYAAKQVLHIYEKKYPDDKRPRDAINAALKCAKKPTKKNMTSAAFYADAARVASYTDAAAARAADSAFFASFAAASASAASASASFTSFAATRAASFATRALRIKILNFGLREMK